MKIRFNGTVEQRTSGCRSCGSHRVTHSQFVYHKSYILPSGIRKTFHAGVVEEVSKDDGDFLLSYACFEEVK